MAGLGRIFGQSGKKNEAPTPQMAIQKLRETEDMLSKKSSFLENKIEKETAAAKKYGMKNKRGILIIFSFIHKNHVQLDISVHKYLAGSLLKYNQILIVIIIIIIIIAALLALKRKKRLEKQLAQVDGTLSTIEFQREAVENAGTNTEVLKNMSYAAKALKAAQNL